MNTKEKPETQGTDRQIIPPQLAVKAMRDSGYRNTAYALAELIDNSVQARASVVNVICLQKLKVAKERRSRRIDSIGVLDNGSGMSSEILQVALQFGNGTYLEDRSGIGRFGMGLPNSSISQCRKVEVWTWQNGPENAIYCYLDVDEIENGNLSSVPIPIQKPLPQKWHKYSKGSLDTSGTLVLWTKLDAHRLSWRGAKSTLENTEFLIGRMYRKFIHNGQLQINLLAFNIDDEDVEVVDPIDREVRVNDPLYLMENSCTPEPFNQEPMFQRWGEKDEEIPISYNGENHSIYVRMSWAKQETVPEDGTDRGSKSYGKHAAKNIGLSIVREGRELVLDPSWTNSYDPVERWWGIEVEFPSTLDEVFGVTNSKQSAETFSRMAQFDWKTEADPGELFSEFRDRIREEGDPRGLLLEIVNHIKEQIKEVRGGLKKQTEGRRRKKRYDHLGVEDRATKKFNERAKQGHFTDADKQKFTPESCDRFKKDLIDNKHYSPPEAEKIAQAVVNLNRKVVFLTKKMDGYSFFNVEQPQGGLTSVVFNTNHPFYEQLYDTLKPEPEIRKETDAELIERIHKAADTFELLFAAWARYEMEELEKEKFFEMRQEWGKMARFFLSNLEE